MLIPAGRTLVGNFTVQNKGTEALRQGRVEVAYGGGLQAESAPFYLGPGGARQVDVRLANPRADALDVRSATVRLLGDDGAVVSTGDYTL
ncbi:MAG: hypothetical protein Q8O40_05950 [Chloroflexota bacterium]|nr:hypothetical protein [Chloroflexota bacterium]